ncbi:MAG: TlpA family protein disulfide reductase, partial [Arenimonas sp.]
MPRPAFVFAPRLLAGLLLPCLLAACERAPAPAVSAAPAPAPTPAPAPVAPPAPVANPDFPSLSIDTWDDGHFDLATHRGQWVVVNFWATWCAPCLQEIPDLAEFDARRDDVQVIGLAFEEIERADMAAFLKEHP